MGKANKEIEMGKNDRYNYKGRFVTWLIDIAHNFIEEKKE